MNTETTDPPLPSASSEPQFAALLACWGKFSSISGIYHPALYHMLDAGHVAQCLLADGTDSAWCRIVARSLSADAGTLAAWLPFWVALHDLGKLTIPFQGEQPAQAARLRALGFKLDGWRAQTYPHSIYSAALIRKIGQVPLPQDLKTVLTHAIGGHHGLYPRSEDRKQAASDLATYEAWDSRWDSLRQASVAYLANVFCPLTLPQMPEIFNISTAVMTLTGFIILVDWLASDETIFKFQPDVTPDAYLAISRAAAAHVVEMHGINRPPTSAAPTAFNQLFTMLPPPRPLQSAIDDIPQELLTGPCLAIIEAPTGEGKTEAALALAHRIARSAGSDAFYYALPTTATSNQMYTRVSDYLDKCLHLPIAVKLVHGQAWLKKDDLFTRIAEGGSDSPPLDDWYDHKKRALLAPFGVGTIDQAELAALNVKHNALRMLGLAGKVVILDEVHAYDAYMSTIIERLLEWFAAVGSSVILLSATLPAARRQTLLQAYAPNAPQNAVASYPNIDIVPAGAAQAQARASGYHAEPAVIQPERVVHLGRLTFGNDIESSAAWLLQAVAQGGCACWIA
ncbi:MAG: CRISPR-associated helicase Cas3', partial [Chloroflexi bacterium]|nr:CRISPR-associated helicase Cas3' [Chloroflexota bacterium]